MSMRQEETDIYVIPPNFIETGTIFGGTIKLRNAIEALLIALIIGLPEFRLPVTLTTKIIIACLTVLPLSLFAIIGINGESLSSFAINFFIYLKNRRIIGKTEKPDTEPEPDSTKKRRKRPA
ncbi:MAG: PrgI family protein, partial [Hungatella hathewayi]|nr:PrgI family protein [Hungatella hathewayi]